MTPPGTAFDDTGRLVPTVGPEYPDEADSAEVRLVAARHALASVIQFATDSRRPITAGRRVLALAWIVGELPGIRTQKDLAAMLGCSKAAACKLTRTAKIYLGGGQHVPAKVNPSAGAGALVEKPNHQ